MLDSERMTAFQERAARVSALHARSRASAPPASQAKVATFAGNATYPLAILACFILGMLTIVFMRWVRFQLSGEVAPNAGLGVFDALLIGGMTMAMREVMHFRQAAFTGANVLGLSIGMMVVHNFVHMLPKVFAWLFSPLWVDVWMHETAFPSLMFGATNIPLV